MHANRCAVPALRRGRSACYAVLLGVMLHGALAATALGQCADPVIIIHENSETRPSALLCEGQTNTFDEVVDFPQGSPCPFLINRFINHVTEVGTRPCAAIPALSPGVLVVAAVLLAAAGMYHLRRRRQQPPL